MPITLKKWEKTISKDILYVQAMMEGCCAKPDMQATHRRLEKFFDRYFEFDGYWGSVHPGMPTGYTFKVKTCPDCHCQVKENWYIRHRKSGCKIGKYTGKVWK